MKSDADHEAHDGLAHDAGHQTDDDEGDGDDAPEDDDPVATSARRILERVRGRGVSAQLIGM